MIFCEAISIGYIGLSIHALLWRDEAPNDGAAALSRTVVLAQRGTVGIIINSDLVVQVCKDCA